MTAGGAGSVVVVGSINEDVVMRVGARPKPGETVSARVVERHPGGKGANQAVAAARAGARVRMVGRVGEDEAGRRMLASLRAEQVDVERVAVTPGVATGTAYITVTPDGENTIVLEAGANGRLTSGDVHTHVVALADAAVVMAQLEVPLEAAAAALQQAIQAGARPLLTFSPPQPAPEGLLTGLDPLLVNRGEAAFLLGEGNGDRSDPVHAAGELLRLGPRSVVVTLGSDGAAAGDASGAWVTSARPARELVDTTGAGDAFAGALAAALAQGSELRDAVQAGLAAGALAVTRAGAR